jgi:hypothetical protein
MGQKGKAASARRPCQNPYSKARPRGRSPPSRPPQPLPLRPPLVLLSGHKSILSSACTHLGLLEVRPNVRTAFAARPADACRTAARDPASGRRAGSSSGYTGSRCKRTMWKSSLSLRWVFKPRGREGHRPARGRCPAFLRARRHSSSGCSVTHSMAARSRSSSAFRAGAEQSLRIRDASA